MTCPYKKMGRGGGGVLGGEEGGALLLSPSTSHLISVLISVLSYLRGTFPNCAIYQWNTDGGREEVCGFNWLPKILGEIFFFHRLTQSTGKPFESHPDLQRFCVSRSESSRHDPSCLRFSIMSI